jgi:hypothetical protein
MINTLPSAVKGEVCQGQMAAVKCPDTFMRKDNTIGIRVPAELKRALSQIAKKEGRSLAQVCEIVLREAASIYKEEGPKYLQRLLSRQNREDQ